MIDHSASLLNGYRSVAKGKYPYTSITLDASVCVFLWRRNKVVIENKKLDHWFREIFSHFLKKLKRTQNV